MTAAVQSRVGPGPSAVTTARTVQQIIDTASRFVEAGARGRPDYVQGDVETLASYADETLDRLHVILRGDVTAHIYGPSPLGHGTALVYPAPGRKWWTAVLDDDRNLCRSVEAVGAAEVGIMLALHGATTRDWSSIASPVYTLNPFADFGSPEGAMDRRHVYFIQGDETCNIKIGITSDISRRMARLQNASSETLRLVGSIPHGGRATERLWHEAYAEHRIHGEWFAPDDALVDAIHGLMCVHEAVSP